MGMNVDMTDMLGLPAKAKCAWCRRMTHTNFDDLDIESGVNPEPGVFESSGECDHCGKENAFSVRVVPEAATAKRLP
jgi:hypothetical protein